MKSDDGCEEKIFHLEKEACGLGRQSPRGERMHRAVSLTCGFPGRSASISDKAQTMWQSPGILEGSSQGWGGAGEKPCVWVSICGWTRGRLLLEREEKAGIYFLNQAEEN